MRKKFPYVRLGAVGILGLTICIYSNFALCSNTSSNTTNKERLIHASKLLRKASQIIKEVAPHLKVNIYGKIVALHMQLSSFEREALALSKENADKPQEHLSKIRLFGETLSRVASLLIDFLDGKLLDNQEP